MRPMDLTQTFFKLTVFDWNGTLVGTRSGKTFADDAADYTVLPGRREVIALLQRHDLRLAIASNQGGIAFGYHPWRAVLADGTISEPFVEALMDIAGREFSIWNMLVCPHHPNASVAELRLECSCRKPQPGMLLELMESHGVAPRDTLMVGDRLEDQEAAVRAGCEFAWADDFFAYYFPPLRTQR